MIAIVLGGAALLLLWGLHPRIGIRDEDAFSYLIGARSLKAGNGFTLLDGRPIAPWPPAYSKLLSLFPDPITAAQWINYFGFAVTCSLFFLLLRRYRWPQAAALAVVAVGASFFFRIITTNAAPDTLTYVLFFSSLLAFQKERWNLACFLWVMAIPFKGLAVLFLPAGLWAKRRGYLWLVPWAVLAYFSAKPYMTGFLNPEKSFPLSERAIAFAQSLYWVPRDTFGWYGTVFEPLPLLGALFFVVGGVLCLKTLRAQTGPWRWGVAYLVPLYLLPLIFGLSLHLRHTAYGWIAILLSFKPETDKFTRWTVWALGVFTLALVNAVQTVSTGGNALVLAQAVQQATRHTLPTGSVATNAYRILDLHGGTASRQILDTKELVDHYLEFLLPNPDTVTTIVNSTPAPPSWCVQWAEPSVRFHTPCPLDKPHEIP